MSRSIEATTAAASTTTITLDIETHQGLSKLLSDILESFSSELANRGDTFNGKPNAEFGEGDVVRMALRRLLKETKQGEMVNGKKIRRRILARELADYAIVDPG